MAMWLGLDLLSLINPNMVNPQIIFDNIVLKKSCNYKKFRLSPVDLYLMIQLIIIKQ